MHCLGYGSGTADLCMWPGHSHRQGPRGLLLLGSLWLGMGHHTVKPLQHSTVLIAAPDVSGGAC